MAALGHSDICLFVGDSLTEGSYGESYVDQVAHALDKGWAGFTGQVLNAGRQGETLASLLARIEELLCQTEPDWVIVAVGGSDVWSPWLSSRSAGWWLWLTYRRIQTGQRPIKDLDRFASAYRALLDRIQRVGAGALACTISPLGENLSSPPNRQLAGVNGVIKRLAVERGLLVADVWQAFVGELVVVGSPSAYLSGEWLLRLLDRRRLRVSSPDQLADRRHLHLTFDGIHLNSRGADLWAKTILTTLARSRTAEPGRALMAGRAISEPWKEDLHV